MSGGPSEQWMQERIYPCVCNDAHRMVSHIRQAVDTWGRGEDIAQVKVVDTDLKHLHLMACPRRPPVTGASGQTACMHFLSLAWFTVSNALSGQYSNLDTFCRCLRRFWLAFAAIGLELVTFARKQQIAVPEEEIRSSIRNVLQSRPDDVQIHSDITNGLADIATCIETYDVWLEFMQVWGQVIDSLPDYWLATLRDNRRIAEQHVTSGAGSMVGLWCAEVSLYRNQSRDAEAQQKKRLIPLGDAVIRLGLQVCEILAVYYSTRTDATNVWTEKVRDSLYGLVHPDRGLLGEERIKNLTDGAELIKNHPGVNDVGRSHIQHILSILQPTSGSGEAGLGGNQPPFPLH